MTSQSPNLYAIPIEPAPLDRGAQARCLVSLGGPTRFARVAARGIAEAIGLLRGAPPLAMSVRGATI